MTEHPAKPVARRGSGGALPTEAQEESAPAARRRKRLETRLAEITAAAAEVFEEVGYDAATLEAIGERVGLSRASLYHYVKSKEDVLVRICLDTIRHVAEEVQAHAEQEPVERFRAFCRSHVRLVCSDPRGRLIGRYSDIRERATELAQTNGTYRGIIETIVADGIRAGVFRPVNLTVLSWSLMLALNGVAAWWTEDQGTPDEIADEIMTYFLLGLQAPGAAIDWRPEQ